jgi:low temperature requirement protein LtrA
MNDIEAAPASRRWRRPLRPRDTDQEHRASTPLELFFDLCFVVAVAQASASLHRSLAADHIATALVGYPTVFFAIWWAWMNFTWFSSAYDNDDVFYRLTTLVQIAGALILAAGVPRAFDDDAFGVITLGYVVMRAAQVTHWLRAAHDDPSHRRTDVRYAVGISVLMVGWVLRLALPEGWGWAAFFVLVVAELAVPVWAERPGPTTWHPGHIVERYGLFTLIVLGESVLSATVALQTAFDAGEELAALATVAAGALLVVFSMWWVYFDQPDEDILGRARERFGVESWRESFVWGYGQYVVLGSAGAVGAGIAVNAEHAIHEADLSARGAALAVAVPVALYLLSVWALHATTPDRRAVHLAKPIAALAVLGLGLVGAPVLAMGLVMAGLVAVVVITPPPPDGAEE